jgi:hypothetical protein
MTWPEGVALELILLGIGWIGLNICTRNVRGFLDLRLETRRQMLKFLDQGAQPSGIWPTQPGDKSHHARDADAEQRIEIFAELGFRMLSFAQNARMAFWIVKLMGYDPIKAGDNLISFSQEAAPAFRLMSVADALRLEEAKPDDLQGGGASGVCDRGSGDPAGGG